MMILLSAEIDYCLQFFFVEIVEVLTDFELSTHPTFFINFFIIPTFSGVSTVCVE